MRHSPDRSTLPAQARALGAISPGEALRWLAAPLIALAVLLMSFDLADAKRVGGGGSFGSKNSYSQSYDKPTPPSKNMTTDRQATPNQQPGAAPGGFMSRFGGIGGMLGGVLLGGMLGSLLFGGMGGGFGILEIVLLGVVGFMVFRFIRSRRAAQAGQPGQTDQAVHREQAAPMGGDRFAYAAPTGNYAPGADSDGWASVRSTLAGQGGSAQMAPPVMPAGIDEAEFISGAKALYTRLQSSWDRRDLEDIRGFTSPEVFAEISRQAGEDPVPGKTDILMIEARVVEAGTQGTQTVISVLYDALLREDQSGPRSSQVREVWHIRRDEAASNPQWILEGIQQLAS